MDPIQIRVRKPGRLVVTQLMEAIQIRRVGIHSAPPLMGVTETRQHIRL